MYFLYNSYQEVIQSYKRMTLEKEYLFQCYEIVDCFFCLIMLQPIYGLSRACCVSNAE